MVYAVADLVYSGGHKLFLDIAIINGHVTVTS